MKFEFNEIKPDVSSDKGIEFVQLSKDKKSLVFEWKK